MFKGKGAMFRWRRKCLFKPKLNQSYYKYVEHRAVFIWFVQVYAQRTCIQTEGKYVL